MPVDPRLKNRQPRAVREQRRFENEPPGRRLRQIESNRERMRTVTSAAIGRAGLKRKPVASGVTFADDKNRILFRIAVIDALLAGRGITDGTELGG